MMQPTDSNPAKWRALWHSVCAVFGARVARRAPIDSRAALTEFIDSRASYVAQSALYGYMKTRAGTRFPELFNNRAMLESINIAKWRVYLACLSDLAMYCGALLRRHGVDNSRVRALINDSVDDALTQIGAPQDADADFAAGAREVIARAANCDFAALGDDDSAFTQSPDALVYWAPVADEFKKRDVEIVRNSVRFRWIAVRREARRRLRADRLMAG